LPSQKSGDGYCLPDPSAEERVGAIERIDVGSTRRFCQKETSNHGFTVICDERAGHHDFDAEPARTGKKCLVSLEIGEPRRQSSDTVDGVNRKQRLDLLGLA